MTADPLSFLFRGAHPRVPVRAIHLDLKGLPPSPTRLMRLLEVIAEARYNALLVEWEDMFPWTVDPRFRSVTAYSDEVIDEFHLKARALNLEIIPLVQCLGHMEMPLAIEEYAALREIPDRFGVLNPLASGAGLLVSDMIDDVLARTPDGIRYFHLGGDEAFTLGSNPQTREFIKAHGKAALYLRHVEPLLDQLIARGIRPILWHDMMHDWDDAALKQLAAKADLMVWGYHGHPEDAAGVHSIHVIERFRSAGVPLWGACAYKGADGHGDQDLPDFQARNFNVKSWTEVAQRFDMKGVVATGWSRYSSLRMQCEPIDGALDALISAGVILHDGEGPSNEMLDRALKVLGERDRFHACRTALAGLSLACEKAWRSVRLLRGQASVRAMDARRQERQPDQHYLDMFSSALSEIAAAGEAVRCALAGRVDDLWIDRYIAERIDPLRVEEKQICGEGSTPA